ncbi:amino acid ABC transporter substrate-binding protein, PAAT family [Rhodospirillales bacterium URHD0017]|nr:amino acid ABC transporter substrate-binding protein, PAAT family [Rhodospirillales bacterium URHD0017]
MSSLCRVSLALALALVVAAEGAAAEPLRVCAEPDNLPFSDHRDRGFELETASLLAADLGRPLQVVYVAQRTHDFLRTTINAGVCDALMGVPAGFDRLATTRPWYRSSYVAVSRRQEALVASFDDTRLRALAIGVAGRGTPPALALARHGVIDNVRTYSLFEPRRVVQDVDAGAIDVAFVWGPFGGWEAAQARHPLSVAEIASDGPEPVAFEIAIGVRKGNEALLQALDSALTRNRAAIADILARWHLPPGG